MVLVHETVGGSTTFQGTARDEGLCWPESGLRESLAPLGPQKWAVLEQSPSN